MVLLRPPDDLGIERMRDAALDQNRDGLVHLVADNLAGQRLDESPRRLRYRLSRVRGLDVAHALAPVLARLACACSVRTRAMSRRVRRIWLVLVNCCVAFCIRSLNCTDKSSISSFWSSSGFLVFRSFLRSELFI